MALDLTLPNIDDEHDVLPVNGSYGICRSYYQPDELDIKALEYAKNLQKPFTVKKPRALDLGCSPYFPQSQRLAKIGFSIHAIDAVNPVADFDKINAIYDSSI